MTPSVNDGLLPNQLSAAPGVVEELGCLIGPWSNINCLFFREKNFRSCRVRRRKSSYFDSSSEELSNIFGDGTDGTNTVVGAANKNKLNIEDLALLEPAPDYEVSKRNKSPKFCFGSVLIRHKNVCHFSSLNQSSYNIG